MKRLQKSLNKLALPTKNIKVINSFYKGMHDMQRCLVFNKIHLLIFYKYFSREVTDKFPFIQDTRANLCHHIKEKYLASIMYFYVLFTVHFVKAWNSHTHLVYTP